MANLEVEIYREPAESVTAEEKIRRSLFAGRLIPCHSTEDVRVALARAEAENKNASHNCWAYRLGPDPEVEYSSDDGEPAGTAGKPILSVIRQSGMVNLLIIVTRWFGGIKLGVRGLIEAYGGIASVLIAQATRIERIRSKRLVISLPYAIIGDVTYLLNGNGMVGAPEWNYGERAEVAADIRISAVSHISELLNELQARNIIYSWGWILPN